MRRTLERCLRRAAALALAVLVAAPDVALAADPPAPRTKSLDSMSQSEIDALVSDINHQANWRMYRRPGDPPDFVPGKPVKVMHGAGSMLGRGGRGGRSFRQAGLSKRNGGKNGNGKNGRNSSAMDRGRNSSRSSGSSFGSSNGSSFGSGSRSSFGSGSSFGNGSSFGSGGSSFGSGGSSFGSGFSNGMQ